MLELAFYNQETLCRCIEYVVSHKELFFYLMYPSKYYSLHIENSDYNSIQYVSKLPNGDVIGYMAAYVDHTNECIENIDLINFTGQPNAVFSRDTISFLDEIFIERNFRKISFHAIADNPAINIYRKLIKKTNGREVGFLAKHRKLTDGQFYDEIIFEIYREEYINTKKI